MPRLVLTRRRGEAIWIGSTRIEIHSCNTAKVQIAIEADISVKIVREELLTKEDNDERVARRSSDNDQSPFSQLGTSTNFDIPD